MGSIQDRACFGEATRTLSDYGAVKDPPTDVLIALAERWAIETGWKVPKS